MSLESLVYEETNLKFLKEIEQIRLDVWTKVLKTPFIHNFEIEIFDSNCPKCDQIISSKLEACPHCNIKFSNEKIKKLEKTTAPSKGRKHCPGCKFYVGVRTFQCDCGYDFKEKVQKASTLTTHYKNPKRKKAVKVKIGQLLDLELLLSNDIQASNLLKLGNCGIDEIENLVQRYIFVRNEIVNFNNRLNFALAKEYSCCCYHLTFEDLVNESVLGMFEAINHFDTTKIVETKEGEEKIVSFSTYCTWWCRKYILDAINKKEKEIRIPDHVKAKYREYEKFYKNYKKEFGSEPSIEEISQSLGVAKKKAESLVFARQYSTRKSILLEDITKFTDSESSEKTTFKGLNILKNGGLDSFELVDRIPEAGIDLLNIDWDKIRFTKPRYREIFYKLKGLFGNEQKSVSELSKEYNLTKVTVYKIKNDTMERLKKHLGV